MRGATVLLEESLARHRAAGNRESIKRGGLGLSLSRLALVLVEQGEYARATALYEECLALHRELGDREGIGNSLLGLGDIAREQGDTGRVRTYCEETLGLFRDLGHTWVGFSLNNLALAAYLDGDLALAASRAAECVALFRELGAGPSLAEVLITLGRVEGVLGETIAATAHLAEALTLAWARGPRFVAAAALEELGMLSVRQGPAQHGVRLLGGAAMLRQAMGTPVRQPDRAGDRGRPGGGAGGVERCHLQRCAGPRGRRYRWSSSSPRHWPARRAWLRRSVPAVATPGCTCSGGLRPACASLPPYRPVPRTQGVCVSGLCHNRR